MIDGIEVTKCPLKEVQPGIWNYVEAYNQYKNGFLPNPGGWLDQPAKMLEAINLIEQYKEKDYAK